MNKSIYDTVVASPDFGLPPQINLGRIKPLGIPPATPDDSKRLKSDWWPIVLPPKRFDDPANPKYDPIRHHPWFARLLQRRAKIDLLRSALNLQSQNKITQKSAAEQYGVDERELRDYEKWIMGSHQTANINQQAIIDHAYKDYCGRGGYRPFTLCLKVAAQLFGEAARPIIEKWEVDPRYFPSNYNK